MMLPIRVELNDPFKVQDRLQYLKVKVQKKFVDMVSDSTFPFIFKTRNTAFHVLVVSKIVRSYLKRILKYSLLPFPTMYICKTITYFS